MQAGMMEDEKVTAGVVFNKSKESWNANVTYCSRSYNKSQWHNMKVQPKNVTTTLGSREVGKFV